MHTEFRKKGVLKPLIYGKFQALSSENILNVENHVNAWLYMY